MLFSTQTELSNSLYCCYFLNQLETDGIEKNSASKFFTSYMTLFLIMIYHFMMAKVNKKSDMLPIYTTPLIQPPTCFPKYELEYYSNGAGLYWITKTPYVTNMYLISITHLSWVVQTFWNYFLRSDEQTLYHPNKDLVLTYLVYLAKIRNTSVWFMSLDCLQLWSTKEQIIWSVSLWKHRGTQIISQYLLLV